MQVGKVVRVVRRRIREAKDGRLIKLIHQQSGAVVEVSIDAHDDLGHLRELPDHFIANQLP